MKHSSTHPGSKEAAVVVRERASGDGQDVGGCGDAVVITDWVPWGGVAEGHGSQDEFVEFLQPCTVQTAHAANENVSRTLFFD